nr:Mur ligase family protein [Roseimicrobium sp. ORNL1]
MRRVPRRIHFLGIHGRLVGSLAMALKRLGAEVSGTDSVAFPPMPALLKSAGIQVASTPHERNLPERVDVVVTGSLVRRGDRELEAAMDRGIPVWNTAAFLQQYFLRETENFVVTGTKGKTSTTAMLLWILQSVGKTPDFLLGGQIRGGRERLTLSGKPMMVLEGDEYPCGVGDPLPKFLRYHPRHVGVTSLQHDHLEVYPSPESYREAFVHLVHQVPRTGSLTLNADDEGAMSLVGLTPTPVTTVGFSRSAATVRITKYRETSSGTKFHVANVAFELLLPGRMHARNAAIAAVMARHAGVSLKQSSLALKEFPGVEGRLDPVGHEEGLPIYTDEAYHPLALRATLEAVRGRHPKQRLVLLFEPRYTSGEDGPWKQTLPESIAGNADVVIAAPPVELRWLPRPFSISGFCRRLRALGTEAHRVKGVSAMESAVRRLCRPGDVVVISFSMIRGEETAAVVEALKEALRETSAHQKKRKPRG